MYNKYMKIQKVSQIDLVHYIDELDEKLNNKRVREILYNEYLKHNGKNTRKTKADKRYVVIAALTRDNFKTQIGDTTVWRVLKVKEKSKSIFDEMKSGDVSIKEAYYKVYPRKESENKIRNNNTPNDDTNSFSHEPIQNESRNSHHMNESESQNKIFDFSSDDDILNMMSNLKTEFQFNKLNHINNTKLREIDGELFALRKIIAKIMEYNDQE